MTWAGGVTGPGFAAQGNILVGEETVAALASTFTASQGKPLAERLLDCLAAAQAAGGDRRGQQSAAILIVERNGGYASLSDVVVDLRVDDHKRPVEELTRLYGLHDLLFGKTQRENWVPVDDDLRSELTERLTRLGYRRPDRQSRSRPGRGSRTSRSESTARRRSTPSCCGSCVRSERRRLRDPLDRRPRAVLRRLPAHTCCCRSGGASAFDPSERTPGSAVRWATM